MSDHITKASGVVEPFVSTKYIQSLRSAGVEHSLAQELLQLVSEDNNTLTRTDSLHLHTTQALLKHQQLVAAARYHLKWAIMELGPTGYPFEQFIGQLLQAHGYTTQLNQMIQGWSVLHEVDIVARKNNFHYLIECKHHHYLGAKTDIKVLLYVYARFLDIGRMWDKTEQADLKDVHQPWVITNTKVTLEALQFAKDYSMAVLAWQYPLGEGLNHLIEAKRLYPITVLPRLTAKEKQLLLEHNIITIQQLLAQPSASVQKKTGIRRDILEEMYSVAQALLTP